jgi:hypothetical protein
LELPTALRQRFLKHGFKEVRFSKLYSNLQPLGDIAGVFRNSFEKHSAGVRFAVRVDALLGKNVFVREGLHMLMEPFGLLDGWLTPLDHGCGMLVVFEK